VRRLAALALLAVLLAGCTPVPAGPAGLALPPRPREVRVDGVDPCSLLTVAQRKDLGLDGRPVLAANKSALYNGAVVPLCSIVGNEPRAIIIGVSVVTSAGLDLWTAGKLAADVRPVQVERFPAVIAVPTRFNDFCNVIVDVAPGQLVDIQAGDGGRKPPIPQVELCGAAQQAAGEAIGTLLVVR
jgi:Protein of unknown function (DUF3558)